MRKLMLFIVTICMVLGCSAGTVRAAASPSLSAKSMVLAKGKTAQLKMLNTTQKVKWSTSDKKVATVSSKGKVTAKKAGTAVITASVSGKKYKCSITVSDKKTKILIVYFSQTGTTKSAAKKIQSVTGGDMVELKTKKTYTSDYDKLTEIAQEEQDKNARPAVSTKINNIKQYDTILLGFPIWWGEEPMAVRTFLESYNLSGKKIVPFCTSGGSGISGSISGIKNSAKGAEVLSGRDVTDMGKASIRNWLKKLGIKTK